MRYSFYFPSLFRLLHFADDFIGKVRGDDLQATRLLRWRHAVDDPHDFMLHRIRGSIAPGAAELHRDGSSARRPRPSLRK